MIERQIAKKLLYFAKKYPVVTITGPRQSGKTTLIKECFPDYDYVNLEKLSLQEEATKDPEGFLSRYKGGLIIDEIQRVPNLTSYIQVIVDERKQDGMFILSGSQNFSLIQSINQSLAGRTAILELLPLSFSELQHSKYYKEFKPKVSKKNIQIKFQSEKLNLDKLMFKGFYPRVYDKKLSPGDFYADYVKTYIERDLREIKEIHNLSAFKKFMRMCASRIGQPLNLTNISNDLGVSSVTLKDWLNILEASYVVYLLEPFYENINKQLIKSPKLYFTDTGLVCYLLGINNVEEIASHPLKGNIFENLIIIEILKTLLNQHKPTNLSFYRDKYHEVDLLYKNAAKFTICEIKLANTIADEFYSGLGYLRKVLAEKIQRESIIYGGVESYKVNGTHILGLESLEEFFKD